MAGKDDWMVTVKEELERMAPSAAIGAAEKTHWDKRSIYRVPVSVVTDLNMKAYKPQFVSFGPCHHGEDHLMPMEEHKHRALLHFLRRSNKPLESYVNSLAEDVAQSLKASYESLDPSWERNTDRFLQMMIVDGCFMIEVLRNFTEATNDYAYNDPIFSNHGKLHIMPYIRRDMLMLENQLPMLVLTTLLAVEKEETKNDEEYVNKLILKFCCRNGFPLHSRMGKCLHLLDVHRKILLWEDTSSETKRDDGGGDKGQKEKKGKTDSKASAGGEEIIRSAMELNEAGINFRKSTTQSLKDISFEGGKLKLPLIVVEDTTESMFLNLIAFERFHVGVGNAVTSYVFIMDSIIDSARDVSLLHDEGIIQNALGSDKAVAALFNSISKDATLDPDSSLDRVHKKVDEYCKQRCNKWRANAKHTYFRNPWAIISLIAAFVLFALTMLQTIYSMLSYYDPQS